MANTNRPFGLKPVRYRNGTPWTGQARHYHVPSSHGTAIYIGDPVDLTGTSNTAEVTCLGGTFPIATLADVTLATLADGNYTCGVVVGVEAVNRESTIYREASTDRVLLVADDPDLIFEVQDDGATALAATSVGLNAILESGTGSTTTGLSGYVLDTNGDAPAADASNMLLIMGLSKRLGNEVAAYAVWEVMLNMHRYKATGDGDGSLGV